MADIAKLERDTLFKKLRAKPENKVRVYRGCLLRPYGVLYLVLLAEMALIAICIASPLCEGIG